MAVAQTISFEGGGKIHIHNDSTKNESKEQSQERVNTAYKYAIRFYRQKAAGEGSGKETSHEANGQGYGHGRCDRHAGNLSAILAVGWHQVDGCNCARGGCLVRPGGDGARTK